MVNLNERQTISTTIANIFLNYEEINELDKLFNKFSEYVNNNLVINIGDLIYIKDSEKYSDEMKITANKLIEIANIYDADMIRFI